jgi:transposase
VFWDETGFSFRSRVGLTWAPTGHTPILRRVSRRRELSTILGLTMSGRILRRHFKHTIHGREVVIFFEHLRQRLRVPIIVIWDGLSAHKSQEVKDYLASNPQVSVEWLPPYAPDLNPEEGCHGNAKQHLRNAVPEDVDQIRRQADREIARIRRNHQLVNSFFQHAGIGVKA